MAKFEETSKQKSAEEREKSISEKEKEADKNIENTASVLSSENQNFFRRMSDKGREIVGHVYQRLHNVPVVDRTIAKMEVAYNQAWADRNEEKAVRQKEKVDSYNSRIESLNLAEKHMNSLVERMKTEGRPTERMELEIKKLEREKEKLAYKKDKAETKLEERSERVKKYSERRDGAADKVIDSFNEKLKPIEQELGPLKDYRDRIDLEIAVTKARHKEKLRELSELEKQKREIEEGLRQGGLSERKIGRNKILKEIEKQIREGRHEIRQEQENLERKRQAINERILEVEAGFNHYKTKQEKFIRVKERRPIKFEKSEEKGDKESGTVEELETTKESKKEKKDDRKKGGGGEEKKESALPRESKSEKESAEDKRRWSIVEYLKEWNKFLNRTYKKENAMPVNIEDFLKTTEMSEDTRLDFEDFRDILREYLKVKKAPQEQVKQFEEWMVKFHEKYKKKVSSEK